jgi:hypothetical protein
MWIIKTGGKTYYVEHVECTVPWSTKETPDNSHTKGSIKVKNCLLTIGEDNVAHLRELTVDDKFRLHNQNQGITRVIVKEGTDAWDMRKYLRDLEIKHGPIKGIGGACSSTFYITDILEPSHFTALGLAMAGTTFRELMPNEHYYRIYDSGKNAPDEHLWEENYEEDDESDEEETENYLRACQRGEEALSFGQKLLKRIRDKVRSF